YYSFISPFVILLSDVTGSVPEVIAGHLAHAINVLDRSWYQRNYEDALIVVAMTHFRWSVKLILEKTVATQLLQVFGPVSTAFGRLLLR
ncbi:hypothetical protein L9F63_020097, partial [Diploptera punctata]